MIHFLLYWIPHITVLTFFWYIGEKNGTVKSFMNNAFATSFSGFATVLVFMAIFYVISLAMRIDSIPTWFIVNKKMTFPTYGALNIIGFFGSTLGGSLYVPGVIGDSSSKEKANNYWIMVGCNTFSVSTQSLVWCIFSMIIPIWTENIMREQLNADVVKDTKVFVKSYNLLSGALENYFLQYFTTLQLISIATLFLMISKVISEVLQYYSRLVLRNG